LVLQIVSSVLTNVTANYLEAERAVLVNVTARRVMVGRGGIVYNIVDDSEVCLFALLYMIYIIIQ
jgi:hypothetical protein